MAYPPRGATSSRWIGARPTPGAIALLVIEGGAFLLYMLLDAPSWAQQHLAMTPGRAIGAEPWQIATSALIHLRGGDLLFDLFSIWIFGSALEQQLGRTRMILIFVLAQLGGALAAAIVGRVVSPDVLISGCQPGAMGLVGAFGAVYRNSRLSLFGIAEMRGLGMAGILIGFTLVATLLRADVVGFASGAAGAAAGYYLSLDGGEGLMRLWRRVRKRVPLRRYKVIPGGRDDKPRRWN